MDESIWSVNSGIFLGYASETTKGNPPSTDDPLYYTGDRHIITVGPNGSGKTFRSILRAASSLTDWSLCIADIKGELCDLTMKHREAAGNIIIRLNPFNARKLGDDGFNPISSLDPDDENFPDDALEMAEAVIRIEGKEPHWAQAAQELVAALIMYVRLVIPDASFGDVRELLGRNDEGLRILVMGGPNVDPRQFELWQDDPVAVKEINPKYRPPVLHRGKLYPGMIAAAMRYKCPEIETKAARFGGITPDDREMHGVLATALTQTRWLDSRPIKASLAKNKFDFSVAREKPVTVYLILPARRLGTHSAWLRLMVTSFIQKLMTEATPSKVPVMLMLDEYAAIAGGSGFGASDNGDGFPIVARNMPMFRGYGIKLWTAWQDLAQAKRIYGSEGFESFLANAGVLQCFAPQDVITSEHLSRLTGQTTRRVRTRGQTRSPNPAMAGGASVTDNVNLGIIPMPLMLPQELRGMGDGFTVVWSHQAEENPNITFLPWPSKLIKELSSSK